MSKEEAQRPQWDSGGTAVQQTLRALATQGFDPEEASEIVTSVSRIVGGALGAAQGQRGVVDVMRTTVGLASRVVRGARKSLPIAPSACADGCSHCCRVHVSISAPEAIVLSAFLRDTYDEKSIAKLAAHVEATAEQVATMDRDARVASKVPCPLLDGDRCAAYPVRPLPCAAANSYDANACASGGEIPIEPIQLGAVRATQLGLSAAIAARGLDNGRYELAGALAITLRMRDAAERWLRGERLFKSTPADTAEEKIREVANAFVARDPHLPRG